MSDFCSLGFHVFESCRILWPRFKATDASMKYQTVARALRMSKVMQKSYLPHTTHCQFKSLQLKDMFAITSSLIDGNSVKS